VPVRSRQGMYWRVNEKRLRSIKKARGKWKVPSSITGRTGAREG
jgi:hypothetical protein